MKSAHLLFVTGMLAGSLSNTLIHGRMVSAQALQSWSKGDVTPMILVKPGNFGLFVPDGDNSVGVSWTKSQVLPVSLVKPSIGGFVPSEGLSIGNAWAKEDVRPVVFVEPSSGAFVPANSLLGLSPSLPVAPQSTGPTGSSPCGSAIETHIDGDFNGWDDQTIYKMDNGTIWQQANYYYHYHYAYHPSVLIFPNGAGICHIKVVDDDAGVDVLRIK